MAFFPWYKFFLNSCPPPPPPPPPVVYNYRYRVISNIVLCFTMLYWLSLYLFHIIYKYGSCSSPRCLSLSAPDHYLNQCWFIFNRALMNKLQSHLNKKNSPNKMHLQMSNATWWRHEMGTLSALLALCEGNHRWPVVSSHKGPVTLALMFSSMWA